MAHHLYHDAPLGVNINLAIVRMIRLEEEENRLNLAVNRNARKTLEFLRDWQQKMNPSDDTHPNHHDVVVSSPELTSVETIETVEYLWRCLYDPPTDHSFEMPRILPGVVYRGDFQCSELLRPNAALCDTGIKCQNLICYVEDKGCLEVGERPGVIDGGWGPWST
ncbi:hypothetical protein ILUMI_14359 [Ignelater luminosus]|uniref:Uncharacterized protein n=1 Tax=Ignelater luminosus TaxID=2038154 RepID=A0A8K0CSM1_IGNLU|nr:hypothetical protein ILUMI_14359 [Ignelater luminosus]